MRGGVNLTPRVRLAHSGVEVANFTDAVNSRVSVDDASRFTGTLGVAAETARARNWRGGELSLFGSADLEKILGGAATSVEVSGERLSSESARTRLLLSLGGTYRRGRTSLGAEVSATGLGSGNAQYAWHVTLGQRF